MRQEMSSALPAWLQSAAFTITLFCSRAAWLNSIAYKSLDTGGVGYICSEGQGLGISIAWITIAKLDLMESWPHYRELHFLATHNWKKAFCQLWVFAIQFCWGDRKLVSCLYGPDRDPLSRCWRFGFCLQAKSCSLLWGQQCEGTCPHRGRAGGSSPGAHLLSQAGHVHGEGGLPVRGQHGLDAREETENQPILGNEVYRELKDGRRLVRLVGYIWLRDWCMWESLFSSFDSLLTPSWSKSCTLRWIGCLQKNRRNKTSSAMSCKSEWAQGPEGRFISEPGL